VATKRHLRGVESLLGLMLGHESFLGGGESRAGLRAALFSLSLFGCIRLISFLILTFFFNIYF
jgi:hypothetical protein